MPCSASRNLWQSHVEVNIQVQNNSFKIYNMYRRISICIKHDTMQVTGHSSTSEASIAIISLLSYTCTRTLFILRIFNLFKIGCLLFYLLLTGQKHSNIPAQNTSSKALLYWKIIKWLYTNPAKMIKIK